MDQTPIPFIYNAIKAIEIVRRHTVHIQKSTGDTKRTTFHYTNDMIYLCQQNAWMDEEALIDWVEEVLCPPHIETVPAGILPILFLDSYWCHMMM